MVRVRPLLNFRLLALQAIIGVLIFGLNGSGTPAMSLVGWIAAYVVFFLLLDALLTKIFRSHAEKKAHGS